MFWVDAIIRPSGLRRLWLDSVSLPRRPASPLLKCQCITLWTLPDPWGLVPSQVQSAILGMRSILFLICLQSAILGMHSIQQRPMVVGGAIVPRPMMFLALTYDHRLVDGREAVTFLRRIKEVIEDPAR